MTTKVTATATEPSGGPFSDQNKARYLFPLLPSRQEKISYKHIHEDLSVQRLNDVHSLLFMAGAAWGISSLHSQTIYGRNIVVCEDASLHLVWYDDIIYIKPMPLYLLDMRFFDQHIRNETGDTRLLINGFLKSYLSLIQHPSDLKVATTFGLLSETITWEGWVNYVHALGTSVNGVEVNSRYQYGELKLRTLNWIILVTFRGVRYHFPHGSYHRFLRRRLTTIIAIFSIIALGLTAMQVLIGIPWVSARIQNVSYWAAILSLWLLVAIVALFVLIFVVVMMKRSIRSVLLVTYRCIHTVAKALRRSKSVRKRALEV